MDNKRSIDRSKSLCEHLLTRKLIQEGFLDVNQVKESLRTVQIRRIVRKREDFITSLRILPGLNLSPEYTPPPKKRARRAESTQSTDSDNLPSTSKYEDLNETELGVVNRINQLHDDGKWTSSTLLPVVGPPARQKVHWDFLLEELKWVHEIFKNERLRHRFYSRKMSSWIMKHHASKAVDESKQESTTNFEREARKNCAQVAKIVREFWQKAEKLVSYGQQELNEARKRADLDKQLSELVEEADKISKSINENNIDEEDEVHKLNGITNGVVDEKKKVPSTSEMEKFAEQARSFQPKGNTLETADVQIKHPLLLEGQLREYQLVGLQWLYALYEKNMNGILADEMGLGKTIQTIGLFAHLAAEKSVWGPHLIVVPTSVILNWEMEFKKWCPSFKILTYFGSTKERVAKRKGWNTKGVFDVCITSYKLFTQDVRCFKQKKWQYLILDEAQHIKNFESQRWRSLINLRTRKRLLLTGTPLQNNLMELWSLLHFLMPTVFASRDDFKDWFNNPINEMIENNGEFNSVVVQRLHTILRPFLLRRLKSEVEKQLPSKTEKVIICELSKRQRYLYNEFMGLRSTVENLRSGSIVSVLNIVMQLRKCCNHPNLFEPRQVQVPFCMESLPFQPFCRQFLINKDREFENSIHQLPILDINAVSNRLSPTSEKKDLILEGLKQDLFNNVVDRINHIKEVWAQNSLNKFGFYMYEAIYPTRQPFFDAVENWHDLYKEKQQNAHIGELHRKRNEYSEAAITNSLLQFPETRLIEYDCGKLQMLAVMLRRLYAQGHRCLIFTQMSKMLDILEAFLSHHQYSYFRLDGSTGVEKRQSLMERFNTDSKVFCFILSTRAGGVGINLTGADTVIFYDSDWNPTMDAQAQDRCHRIGQTKDVTIYRLISRNSIEENILKKARQKRRLGELAIDEAGFTPAFFKKTDNIRDLFYDNEDESASKELGPIQLAGDEEEIRKAMENVEDGQDVQAAKEAEAEIVAEDMEFNAQPIKMFDNSNEEFVNLVNSLQPVEQFAVHFVASQLDEPEYDSS